MTALTKVLGPGPTESSGDDPRDENRREVGGLAVGWVDLKVVVVTRQESNDVAALRSSLQETAERPLDVGLVTVVSPLTGRWMVPDDEDRSPQSTGLGEGLDRTAGHLGAGVCDRVGVNAGDHHEGGPGVGLSLSSSTESSDVAGRGEYQPGAPVGSVDCAPLECRIGLVSILVIAEDGESGGRDVRPSSQIPRQAFSQCLRAREEVAGDAEDRSPPLHRGAARRRHPSGADLGKPHVPDREDVDALGTRAGQCAPLLPGPWSLGAHRADIGRQSPEPGRMELPGRQRRGVSLPEPTASVVALVDPQLRRVPDQTRDPRMRYWRRLVESTSQLSAPDRTSFRSKRTGRLRSPIQGGLVGEVRTIRIGGLTAGKNVDAADSRGVGSKAIRITGPEA